MDDVATLVGQVRPRNPLHVGNTGAFEYYSDLFDSSIPADG